MGRKKKKRFEYLKSNNQKHENSKENNSNKNSDKKWENNLSLDKKNNDVEVDKETSKISSPNSMNLGVTKEMLKKDKNEDENMKYINSDTSSSEKKSGFIGYNSYNHVKEKDESNNIKEDIILVNDKKDYDKYVGFKDEKELSKEVNFNSSDSSNLDNLNNIYKNNDNNDNDNDKLNHDAYNELSSKKPKTFLEYTKIRKHFGLNQNKVQKQEQQIEYLQKKGMEISDKTKKQKETTEISEDNSSSKYNLRSIKEIKESKINRENKKEVQVDILEKSQDDKDISKSKIKSSNAPVDNRYSKGINPSALGIVTKRVPKARISNSNTEILTKSSFRKMDEKNKKGMLKRRDSGSSSIIKDLSNSNSNSNKETNNIEAKEIDVKITENKIENEKDNNQNKDNIKNIKNSKKMELPNGLIVGSGYTLTDKYKKHRDLTEIENRHKNSLYALVYKGEKKKMESNDVFLTLDGLSKLEEELKHLKTEERESIAERLKTAKSYGDLSENGEYDEAKSSQEANESRIAELEELIASAQIINEDNINTDLVGVGNTVYITNISTNKEQKYTIVGTAESDILDGKISNESPIAKSLIGAKVGDIIQVEAPVGIIEYKIKKITL